MNEEQYNSLISFKRQIIAKKILKDFSEIDDPVLLRFLRARKFVVPKSLEMIENYLTWRREHNVDELINFKFDCLKELKKVYPHGYHKTDKIVLIIKLFLFLISFISQSINYLIFTIKRGDQFT